MKKIILLLFLSIHSYSQEIDTGKILLASSNHYRIIDSDGIVGEVAYYKPCVISFNKASMFIATTDISDNSFEEYYAEDIVDTEHAGERTIYWNLINDKYRFVAITQSRSIIAFFNKNDKGGVIYKINSFSYADTVDHQMKEYK